MVKTEGGLTDFVRSGDTAIITGPYGTSIKYLVEKQQKKGFRVFPHIGEGCSALIGDGQELLLNVTSAYLDSIDPDQALILVTDSFRLAKQNLESLADEEGYDSGFAEKGLLLVMRSNEIAVKALERSNRNAINTFVAASIGPPFQCYRGDQMPLDISNKYLPQTFSTVRFTAPDYLMFETVPIIEAAIGAAEAFYLSHRPHDVEQSAADFKSSLNKYMSFVLRNVSGSEKCPSYDRNSNTFSEIERDAEYVISLCMNKDGKVWGLDINEAIERFDDAIGANRYYEPVGFGINCNSPEVTGWALDALSPENRGRIIGVHVNASNENDPLKYHKMTSNQAIPLEEFTPQLIGLGQRHDLVYIGGCCGTGPEHMKALGKALKKAA